MYNTKNLKYSNPTNTTVDMEIEHPEWGWIPFTASPNDTEASGRELYAKAIAGDLGDIAPYDGLSEEEMLVSQLRTQRDNLLVELDAIVGNPLRWASMTEQEQGDWSVYRQELLDVPQQEGFPNDVTWPEKP